MKIRYGISISSVETLNDLPGLPAFEIVEVPGELSCGEKFSLPSTVRGKRLWIRNSEDIRFFRSLPDAGIGVRQEFFQLFLQRCSTAQKLRAESSSIAPDLENAFDDHGYEVKLREALGACFGIAERFRLPLMLETRIPGAAATAPDEFLRFKHSLFYPVRTMCVLHPHEPGALEALEKFAGECKFDCDIFRICFDAASGNYLSENLFRRVSGAIRKSGFADPVVIFDPGSNAEKNAYAELNLLVGSNR